MTDIITHKKVNFMERQDKVEKSDDAMKKTNAMYLAELLFEFW
jgi:hypothetical protein